MPHAPARVHRTTVLLHCNSWTVTHTRGSYSYPITSLDVQYDKLLTRIPAWYAAVKPLSKPLGPVRSRKLTQQLGPTSTALRNHVGMDPGCMQCFCILQCPCSHHLAALSSLPHRCAAESPKCR